MADARRSRSMGTDKPVKHRDESPLPSGRLVALDAYRGLVMLAMISGGLELASVAARHPDHRLWQFVGYQAEHAEWVGCAAWDMIQPSFMFIVGVAIPYSLAARQSRGDSPARQWMHVLWRSAFLVALGIFLRSNGHERTNFTFEDVVTQIGLGYPVAYALVGRGLRVQLTAAAVIAVGYWLLFALRPLPPAAFDAATLGIPDDWQQLTGFAAHWNKHLNPVGDFDRWFLNLFPRAEPFRFNGGGYQTLSFVPSILTTLAGLMAGEWLRGPATLDAKIRRLAWAGLACLAVGMAADGRMWPLLNWQWSLCPVVKRIWTPSWAVFSTGWALLALAAALWLVDLRGYRRSAWPLVVVGMNSLALYVGSWLLGGWILDTIRTHFGQEIFEGTWGPTGSKITVVVALWLLAAWMHRRGIFLRV